MSKALDYFGGDELAASVWIGKYALKNEKGEVIEETPDEMHLRMAKEFARVEDKYEIKYAEGLSKLGQTFNVRLHEAEIFALFKDFKYIVPQGSIMSMLGNKYAVGSLSNCFVVPAPYDSYGGIIRTDQHLVQLMKRRGGVGTNLNSLRPSGSIVKNAAGTSTGTVSFMDRYSNTTREVAQNGRRGALMLLLSVKHPEIFNFIKVKNDRTKVTGANISVMLTDRFMEAAENDADFYCAFPIEITQEQIFQELESRDINALPYNELIDFSFGKVMRTKAREIFDLIVENAWENAEPGVAYMDRVVEYSPEGVYPQFRPIASNPCGEQWMQAHDACRLLAMNLFGFVVNPFTKDAYIDYDKLYEVSYLQQRLADDIVDLEIEYVDRIISKIQNDPEPNEVKATELELWLNIRATATASRRTGCGITALGDMLAAVNLKYDSAEALHVIDMVMKTKMMGELDCTIDLAITRGTFQGWDRNLEFIDTEDEITIGANAFYKMLQVEFPQQYLRMYQYGRRSVSFSTIAPTGSVSILTQTTSGLEPLFLPFYMRRKKVNPSDEGVRVDFVDQNGDSWTEYPILHPKFKDWILTVMSTEDKSIDTYPKEVLEDLFKRSPWYGATANDIDWSKRVEIQSVLQKYTTNAISSTINLPNDVSKDVVSMIYMSSWKAGLKGVTIYRDGCRTGVLVAETKPKVEINKFGYSDAVKRPKELQGELHTVSVKGEEYAVVVGLMDENPYEIFAFKNGLNFKKGKGLVVRQKKGVYHFIPNNEAETGIANLQEAALHADQQILTRMISAMLRHGMNPHFIISQVDKTPLEIVSFGKAVTRVLKYYIKEEELKGKLKCNECGSDNIRLEEGCSKCMECGSSKCG